MYGLGQMTNLLALFIVWVVSRLQQTGLEEETLERTFGVMQGLMPPDAVSRIAMFIFMVFGAGIFEEFICRGVMLNALKPYGNGFAIIITGFLFGIMHGNFQQFTYAFVLGIVLGYITIQTGSILAATILHAMFNSIAAVGAMFLSTQTVQDLIYYYERGFDAPVIPNHDAGMAVLAGFGMYMAFFFTLLIAGIALAVKKLTLIKKYKAINDFTEINTKKKTLIFFMSVPAFLMIIMTIDKFAGSFVLSKVFEILAGR
jgi:hypothetical protein